MSIEAYVESISLIPSTSTDSQIIVDFYLINEDRTETITEYGPLETLIKKYHIKRDGNNYDWSELQDKECSLTKQDNRYEFEKYK